ncbi:MAG: hypothetical protein KIS81_08570 [Maricaulaceae bacterium]|nr:hypothetical protein [Maricaulaceae bacterium]
MHLDLIPTLVLMAMFAGLFVLASRMTARAPDPAKGPRMIPWTMIAVLAGFFAFLMFVHVLNLFGIETGRGRPM